MVHHVKWDADKFSDLSQLADLAAKAYNRNLTLPSEEYEQHRVYVDDRVGSRVLFAWKGAHLHVAFTGTEPKDWRDWRQVLSVAPAVFNDVDGPVHGGFAKAANSLRSITIAEVQAFVNHHRHGYVTLTGHSMGGALAELLHASVFTITPNTRSVTFGAPALYTAASAQYWSSWLAGRSLRITHGCDLVPGIAQQAGYRHATTDLHLPATFYTTWGPLTRWKDYWKLFAGLWSDAVRSVADHNIQAYIRALSARPADFAGLRDGFPVH